MLNQASDTRLTTTYTVIATQDTLLGDLAPNIPGFQAVLLKDTAGHYVIAFRGTETDNGFWNAVTDLATDASMARGNFTIQMTLALTFIKEALNRYSADGLSIDNLTLTGHSLGGSLAEVAGYTFGMETYAYNPFGVKWSLLTSPVSYYATLSALDITSVASEEHITNVVNVGGAFSDPVTGFASNLLGSYLGEIVYVKDSAGGSPAGLAPHGMEALNKSIEVYNTLIVIFPDQNYASLTAVLDRIRPGNQQVPRFLQSLGEIVGAVSSTDTGVLVQNIKTAAPSGMSLIGLADVSTSSLQSQATDQAYLYALLELNPFVVVGADYSHLNQDGELDRTTYSDPFIEDRAMFLYHLTNPNQTSSYNIEFYDATLGIVAYSNLALPAETRVNYHFGSEDGNQLTGDDQADHLYGMGGNDVLTGGKGNDYLEGGKGNDVYIWNTGDGNDTIVETREEDGQIHGVIKISNGQGVSSVAAGAFERQGTSNTWEKMLFDGTLITLTHNATWQLTMPDGSILDLGQDFRDGDFGIELQQETIPSPQEINDVPIYGDLAPVDFIDVIDGIPYIYHQRDALGNIIVNPGMPEPGRADQLYGSNNNDHLLGYDGDDSLFGRAGNDLLEGGNGDDDVWGETGNEVRPSLFGGTTPEPRYKAASQRALQAVYQRYAETA